MPEAFPISVHSSTDTAAEAQALDTLVERLNDGDVNAYAAIVGVLHQRVYRWALAFAADADEADDLMQETFVLALRHIRQYNGGGAFAVWIYRIVRRAAGHMHRRRARRTRLAAGPKAAPERIVYETDPGARVDRDRLSALVREFWRDLPQQQRTVLDLVDLQGYRPKEAAEMLELNPTTLRANLFKARHAIRARMLAHYRDAESMPTGERP
jgi:RNA polymerase sigma-70 factor (ECF subfamily)